LARASAKHVLNDITIPTLVLNAKNDPFLPGRYLPLTAAKCVQLDYPEHGGHVGFVSGKIPGNWIGYHKNPSLF
jgi:predicted alpha/beta-fold hydrolase